jgi:type IV pilus assembly protein PilY1
VAIVSNGYESDNGHAVLFILDIKTGAVLQKIDTGVGTVTDKNGLSAPFVADIDDDYIADVVYAGDLYGNLWKFDLSGIVGSFTAPSAPLFVACTVTGPVCSRENRQAITGQPSVGRVGGSSVGQSNKGVMVYFGTGKYFETGDNIVGSDPQIQTFYGLWDKGSAITDRSSLQEQTILYEGFQTLKDETATPTDDKLTAHPVRVVSSNPVCYSTKSPGCTEVSPSKKGWMLDLVKPVDVVEGERFVSFVDLNHGLVSFSTLIPSSDVCERGGRSWAMDLDAMTGGSFRQPAFSINNDRFVDSKDTVTIDGVDYFGKGNCRISFNTDKSKPGI